MSSPVHPKSPTVAHTANATTINTTVPVAHAQTSSAPQSPHTPTKAELKDHKNFEKLLEKDAKADAKHLKHAMSEAEHAAKADAKALKEKEQAKKDFEKAKDKEYKLNKELIKAQEAQQKAAAELQKAQQVAEAKIKHSTEESMRHKSALRDVDRVKAENAQHEETRQRSLAADPIKT